MLKLVETEEQLQGKEERAEGEAAVLRNVNVTS